MEVCVPPAADACEYVRAHCHSEGRINYIGWYYCQFKVATVIAALFILAVSFLALGITASDYLCPNLYAIAQQLHLSDEIAGLTLLAFGNGAPDIMSTFTALRMDSGSLALSELVGACLFIITVVVGTLAFIKPFQVKKRQFVSVVVFMYMVGLMTVAIAAKKLSWELCVVMVASYSVFVVGVVTENRRSAHLKQLQAREQRVRNNFAPDGGDMEEQVTIEDLETEAVIPGTYGVRMMIKELSKHSHSIRLPDDDEAPAPLEETVPISTPIHWILRYSTPTPDEAGPLQYAVGFTWAIVVIFGPWWGLAGAVVAAGGFYVYREPPPLAQAIFGFVVALCWISVYATEIVSILQFFGIIYGVSDDILGLTIFAVGNSVGDFISNITIANMGMPVMAFGACFGGPLLAICSLGVSALMVMDGGSYPLHLTSTVAIAAGFVIVNCTYLLVVVPRNDWTLDRSIGTVLLANWLGCTLFCLILELIK
ncbi:hypothetical protein DICA4_F34508 [Diutina catenulata]